MKWLVISFILVLAIVIGSSILIACIPKKTAPVEKGKQPTPAPPAKKEVKKIHPAVGWGVLALFLAGIWLGLKTYDNWAFKRLSGISSSPTITISEQKWLLEWDKLPEIKGFNPQMPYGGPFEVRFQYWDWDDDKIMFVVFYDYPGKGKKIAHFVGTRAGDRAYKGRWWQETSGGKGNFFLRFTPGKTAATGWVDEDKPPSHPMQIQRIS